MSSQSERQILRADHVHFIDGARGGYATAATALKAMA
jgi:hypothetical protein